MPNAMGGNAVRLGALFGGPVLAAVLLARRRAAVPPGSRPGPRPGDRRQPLLAADRERHPDRPLASATPRPAPPTSSRRRTGCAPTAAEGTRIEVPPTANHWESAYLAPKFELARGWLRQLDTTRDDLFYDDRELTDRHLRRLAARQRDHLRRPPRRPARLLLRRRAPADPRRPALPDPALSLPALADLRSARPEAAGRPAGRAPRRRRSGSAARASPSTSTAPASSSSASTSPPTGRSPAAPAASSAAATGPSPAPPTPASSASPPTSPSAGRGMRSRARARRAEKPYPSACCWLGFCP